MKSRLTLLFVFVFLMTSCSPKPGVPQATVTGIEDVSPPTTTVPTNPTPTEAPIVGPETPPVPTLQIGDLVLPDPRLSDRELFSLSQPDAPIPLFVSAMNQAGLALTAEQVSQSLIFTTWGNEEHPLLIAVYPLDPDPSQAGETLEGEIPLVVAAFNSEAGAYAWRKITPALLADHLGLKFWTQTLSWKLDDPIYTQMILDNVNGLVCAGDFEWDDLFGKERSDLIREMIAQIKNGEEPDIRQLDFTGIDRLTAFAAAHDMQIMVLHLFDPMDIPPDIAQDVVNGAIPYEDFERFMEWYVKMIVTRYPLAEWSVLNEFAAFSLWGGEIYKPFVQFLLDRGFHHHIFAWAHEAAPQAILILNENFRRPGQSDETMVKLTDAYLALLSNLLQNGAPVMKAGIQGHVSIYAPSTPEEISSFIARVRAIGVPMVGFTEVTVGISEHEPAVQAEIEEAFPVDENLYLAQARFYQSLLSATITSDGDWASFGFSDAYSMFNDLGTPEVAALPLDDAYHPKAAYYGLVQVLYRQLVFEQWLQTTQPDDALVQSVLTLYANAMGLPVETIQLSWGHVAAPALPRP